MSEDISVVQTPLEAKSPFELRVGLSKNVPEADVRIALATGDMGFLHSFTTGSAVDGPGVRVVAWTSGCMWRCVYCHNPDTWTMTNGIPVTIQKAAEELRKYRHGLKVMSGGLTISGGEPLMQHRFVVKLFTAAKAMSLEHDGHLVRCMVVRFGFFAHTRRSSTPKAANGAPLRFCTAHISIRRSSATP